MAKKPIGEDIISTLDKMPLDIHFITGGHSWIKGVTDIITDIQQAVLERNKNVSEVGCFFLSFFISKCLVRNLGSTFWNYASVPISSTFYVLRPFSDVRQCLYLDPDFFVTTLPRPKLYFVQNCTSTSTARPIRSPDLTKGRSKADEVERSK